MSKIIIAFIDILLLQKKAKLESINNYQNYSTDKMVLDFI